jgi:dinuclear metal center YbgI/SA1388 family protein
MVLLRELVRYLDDRLALAAIPGDDSNNGLQVEASCEVRKAVFGVDATQALIDRAAEAEADFIFVHHGLSWGEGFRRLTGLDARRVGALFRANLSLYAAHLPLDAHPEIGHNACLAKAMGLTKTWRFAEYHGAKIGVAGHLPRPQRVGELAQRLVAEIGGSELVYGDPEREIRTVGVISGGAGPGGVLAAAAEGLDCLFTGEANHTSYHFIAETGLTVIVAGHYASETPGVRAVMHDLAARFKLTTEFIDLPTGL